MLHVGITNLLNQTNLFNLIIYDSVQCNAIHAIPSYYDKLSYNQLIYYNISYLIAICRLFMPSINLLKEYVIAGEPLGDARKKRRRHSDIIIVQHISKA